MGTKATCSTLQSGEEQVDYVAALLESFPLSDGEVSWNEGDVCCGRTDLFLVDRNALLTRFEVIFVAVELSDIEEFTPCIRWKYVIDVLLGVQARKRTLKHPHGRPLLLAQVYKPLPFGCYTSLNILCIFI